jgi:very-short-patch-repair endonuclease
MESGPGCSRDVEDRIAAVAAGQHALVTRQQLMQLGLSRSAVARRVASGRLQVMHRGVYLVGPLKPRWATELAAVLAGGPLAVLSHTSAQAAWAIGAGEGGQQVHVSVPGSGRGRRPGIRFHRVGPLADDERAVVHGIPVTSPARTLVDVAGMVGSRELERAVAVALREGLISLPELAALPRRYPGRPGMGLIQALAGDLEGPRLTRSEAERRCIELFCEAGIEPPHTNVSMGPYELDLFWPDEDVAVEIDGWAHHSSRPRFEGDRRKDAWLRARGIEVVRVTWRQITRDRLATAVQVAQILTLARAQRSAARQSGPARQAP